MFEFIGNISDIAGAIGAVISAVGVLRLLWLKRREGEEVSVTLSLQGGSQSVPLPVTVTFWVLLDREYQAMEPVF